MENKEKKPKCYGCRKREQELLYFWFNGHLWHYYCWKETAAKVEKNIRKNIESEK